MADTNPLELSDEEFLKEGAPPSDNENAEDASAAGSGDQTEQVSGGTGNDDTLISDPVMAGSDNADADGGGSTDIGSSELAGDENAEGKDQNTPPAVTAQAKASTDTGAVNDPKTDDEPGTREEDSPSGSGKGFVVPTSFQANGKTIEIRDATEATKLMQMGANYTRKMQELAPHRKTLMMLQSNNIDQERLDFLIALDKKDPEAIRKLIKDSGIDPLEIDTAKEPAYLGGTHTLSDEEVNFRTQLDELAGSSSGKETMATVMAWDDASKEVLWKNPEIMSVIHQQREQGVFDTIAAEVERRITLGHIPAGTPFLQAYHSVGEELARSVLEAQGGGQEQSTAATNGNPGTGTGAQPVATRVAAPKPKVVNGDKASAASPTRSTPKEAKPFVNPLSMSDDEFLKSMNGRV